MKTGRPQAKICRRRAPFLDADFLGARARLRRHQLFEVPYGVILVALDAHLRWVGEFQR
jgi:hypothetical protein